MAKIKSRSGVPLGGSGMDKIVSSSPMAAAPEAGSISFWIAWPQTHLRSGPTETSLDQPWKEGVKRLRYDTTYIYILYIYIYNFPKTTPTHSHRHGRSPRPLAGCRMARREPHSLWNRSRLEDQPWWRDRMAVKIVIFWYGGFLSHGYTPKSSKSWATMTSYWNLWWLGDPPF